MIQSLKEVYLKNLNSLMTEISLYNSEEDIWKVEPGILNSAGNLTLHLMGNLNFFIANHKCINTLSFNIMWICNNGTFNYLRMFINGIFHFRSANAVTGNIYYIVNTSYNSVISICIAFTTIAGKIEIFKMRKII